ncbi:ice-structuring glycoprotein-like [Brachypodium distachyon]|uniref:ice-structuring glycoprotein-like n=1 Tax=Brachypodium distachyon TaxID=15368 RepID=UPI00052FFF85|nr:ice-structuring glycoprotein-like [Brachypodium distachyon]|eukprot:XP_010229671.1 ice-structuring glycoprotein-like [Brachypodium distachyon]
MDDDDEDSDNTPLIVRRSRAFAAAVAASSVAPSAQATAAKPAAAAAPGVPVGTLAAAASVGVAGAAMTTSALAATAGTASAAAPGALVDSLAGALSDPATASAATAAGGMSAPAPGASATVINLDSVVEVTGAAEDEIHGLRVKLEVQVKATEDAVGAAAWHEIQLGSAKDRAAKLETELTAVREELAKAGNAIAVKTVELAALEDNVRKAKKAAHDAWLHHSTLIGQRQIET